MANVTRAAFSPMASSPSSPWSVAVDAPGGQEVPRLRRRQGEGRAAEVPPGLRQAHQGQGRRLGVLPRRQPVKNYKTVSRQGVRRQRARAAKPATPPATAGTTWSSGSTSRASRSSSPAATSRRGQRLQRLGAARAARATGAAGWPTRASASRSSSRTRAATSSARCATSPRARRSATRSRTASRTWRRSIAQGQVGSGRDPSV